MSGEGKSVSTSIFWQCSVLNRATSEASPPPWASPAALPWEGVAVVAVVMLEAKARPQQLVHPPPALPGDMCEFLQAVR